MSYLGIDVGGTTIKYALVTSEGQLSQKGSVDTPKGLESLYQTFEDIYHRFDDVEGLALSMPGAVDSDNGDIKGASALPFIHGPNIKHDLEERLGTRVELENDANCAALAEVWLGAAREVQDCCFIVCGTGIGGAVIKDRKIHKGIHLHGGEFGFMINTYDIEKKSFQIWSMDSTVATVKKLSAKLGRELDGKEVFDHYKENEEYTEAIDHFYYMMAMGIYNLQYAYDPELIVLGGGISIRDDIVEEISKRIEVIRESVQIASIQPVIKTCEYANDANIVGAVYHFMNKENG